MNLLVAKLVGTFFAVVLSVMFGILPEILAAKWSMRHPRDPEYDRTKKRNICLAFLLDFGGGVLIANCFCHWLPEVRKGIGNRQLDTSLPLPEIVMCVGFFFICFLEETIHYFLHSKNPAYRSYPFNPNKVLSSSSSSSNGDESNSNSDRKESLEVKVSLESSERERKFSQNHNAATAAKIGLEAAKVLEEAETKDESDDHAMMSHIRTFFVISALSFHSVVEGLALSLEDEVSGVWMNFGALLMHKLVIAFSVGVELISAQVTRFQYWTSILVFSLAPALGVSIGVVIMGANNNNNNKDDGGDQSGIDDFVIQIFQGIATGTILYVVFFEIFPKAKEVGGSGFMHVFAMTTGFALFLPSLLFHSHKETSVSATTVLTTILPTMKEM